MIEVHGPSGPRYEEILTPEALGFVEELHRRFNPERIRRAARTTTTRTRSVPTRPAAQRTT